MAAAYAFHICKNHPFVDGNKRAGFAAMLAFLTDNGWRFEHPRALVASPHLEEFKATVDDVMSAVPIVTDLLALAERAEAEGNSLVAAHCYAQVELLITLYRIAEGQSYEW
jgi:prophage maintenance system killer protein